MPRGRRKTKAASTLLTALRYAAVIQKAIGAPETTHCRLFNKWLMATNGVLSLAHSIQEEIQVCPHTHTFVDALEQAPGAVNITKLDEQRLSVSSESFQAIVPCIPDNAIPVIYPDPAIAECDDRLTAAMMQVAILISDAGQKLVTCSIQLRNGSCVTSDGNLILEAWHGIPMPPLLLVPKTFAVAENRLAKTIYQFGFSDRSLTLWHSDGSWLKGQLYPANSDLPNLDGYLNAPAKPSPIAEGLADAVARLEPFSADGQLAFTQDGLRVTDPALMLNATVEFVGVPSGLSFNLNALRTALKLATSVHWNASQGISIFHGNNLRGAIATKVG
jgi:hypothetical protein